MHFCDLIFITIMWYIIPVLYIFKNFHKCFRFFKIVLFHTYLHITYVLIFVFSDNLNKTGGEVSKGNITKVCLPQSVLVLLFSLVSYWVSTMTNAKREEALSFYFWRSVFLQLTLSYPGLPIFSYIAWGGGLVCPPPPGISGDDAQTRLCYTWL